MDRRELIKNAALASGVVMTTPLWISTLNGCKPADPGGVSSGFLASDQLSLLDSISDTILPADGTPGARDVQVVECIDGILKDCYSEEQVNIFKSGMDLINSKSNGDFQRSFSDLTEDQKAEILTSIESEAYGNEPGEEAGRQKM